MQSGTHKFPCHPPFQWGTCVTEYYKYSDDIPETREIERLVAGHPDAEQLIAIISRSYDYIRNLPLKDIKEDYRDAESDFSG
jgi:hypothetical protein